MSKFSRLEWTRQVAALNERIKGFQANPTKDQLEAAIDDLRAYAEAARAGGIEIPSRFTAN